MDETGGSGTNSSKSLPEKEKGDANEAFTGKKVKNEGKLEKPEPCPVPNCNDEEFGELGEEEDYSDTDESSETGSDDNKSWPEKEESDANEECNEKNVKNEGKREKKPCPVPNCNANVVHLPKHLRNVHKWHAEYARTALSRFKLRKKYEFASQEAASAGNHSRKKSEEKKTKPKPNRKRKICPLPGCMVITERLPQHLQRTHKLKREDPKYKKYLSLAKVVSTDKPHVFMRMKEEMGRMQRLTPEFVVRGEELEDTCDNSEDGFLLNVQSYDCDERQDVFDLSPPEDELAEMTESTEMASSVARNNSETETKVLNQFCNWMLSPDGEQKDRKTATQHVAQVKRIISTLGKGLECLLDKKEIRDVFLPNAKEKYHPATIKSYLTSLQHFCSFLLEDNPSDVNFEKDTIIILRDKLKKWSASYKRDTTKRRWERQEEDVSALITPETVKAFEMSQATRDAVVILGRLSGKHNLEITQARYTLVRDYLIAQIMIDNANRSGVVAFMTVQEFRRAKMEDDRYVVKVLEHKTVDTHGPAQVVLTVHLYNCLDIFLKEMRSKLPGAQMEGKQPLFLSWAGNKLQSSQITCAIGSIFKKAGVEGRVHHTLYRKSAVTRCHDKYKEISSNLADLMAHRESTAEKYYRHTEKTKSSVKASQRLHATMRGYSPTKKENETVEKCREDIQEESAPLSRSPWKEDSLQALREIFEEEISAQDITLACVREKIESHPVLGQEDPKRVYDRIRAEWRYKANIDDNSNEDDAKLPEEKEDIQERVNRLFSQSEEELPERRSLSSDFVSVTESTVRSKGLFTTGDAKALVDIFQDMVVHGKPISKPVIIKRLSSHETFKRLHVDQVVNRLKYERKQWRKLHPSE